MNLSESLQLALDQERAARQKLDTLRTRIAGASERVAAAREQWDLARAALKRAAGEHAAGYAPESNVVEARAALVAAEQAHEAAELEAEGVGDVVAGVELELEGAECQVRSCAIARAVELNDKVESEINALIAKLDPLFCQHRGLARFAWTQAHGLGRHDEPIPFHVDSSVFGRTMFAVQTAAAMNPTNEAARDTGRRERHYVATDLV